MGWWCRKKLTAADEFWCDLVAGGVGGWTIDEAKQRLTYDEAKIWHAYMHKRGTLNLGLHLEAGIGLLTWIVHTAVGGKLPISRFTPHLSDAAGSSGGDSLDLATASPQEVYALMSKLAAHGKTPDPSKPKKKIRTFTPKKKN